MLYTFSTNWIILMARTPTTTVKLFRNGGSTSLLSKEERRGVVLGFRENGSGSGCHATAASPLKQSSLHYLCILLALICNNMHPISSDFTSAMCNVARCSPQHMLQWKPIPDRIASETDRSIEKMASWSPFVRWFRFPLLWSYPTNANHAYVKYLFNSVERGAWSVVLFFCNNEKGLVHVSVRISVWTLKVL
jgi:hypothetical protein